MINVTECQKILFAQIKMLAGRAGKATGFPAEHPANQNVWKGSELNWTANDPDCQDWYLTKLYNGAHAIRLNSNESLAVSNNGRDADVYAGPFDATGTDRITGGQVSGYTHKDYITFNQSSNPGPSFGIRTTAPAAGNACYFSTKNPFYPSYSPPNCVGNCTWYAWVVF